jgi:hypothetical protein
MIPAYSDGMKAEARLRQGYTATELPQRLMQTWRKIHRSSGSACAMSLGWGSVRRAQAVSWSGRVIRHTGQIVFVFLLVNSPIMLSSTCLRIADHRVEPGSKAASFAGMPTVGSDNSSTQAM